VISDPESSSHLSALSGVRTAGGRRVHRACGTVRTLFAVVTKTAMKVTGLVALALADTWWTALAGS
jgi:hypothetical protein